MKKYVYSIGEVADMLDLKPSVLRYWETEFHSLRPRKKSNRIRKYDEPQIDLLKKIKYMLYVQRFTIEGAKNQLRQEKTGTADQSIAAAHPVNAVHNSSDNEVLVTKINRQSPSIALELDKSVSEPLSANTKAQETISEIRQTLEYILHLCQTGRNQSRDNKSIFPDRGE